MKYQSLIGCLLITTLIGCSSEETDTQEDIGIIIEDPVTDVPDNEQEDPRSDNSQGESDLDNALDALAEDAKLEEVASDEDFIKFFTAALENATHKQERDFDDAIDRVDVPEAAPAPAAPSEDAVSSPGSNDGASGGEAGEAPVSDTNTIVAGVDEADLVKTDGELLYHVVRDNQYDYYLPIDPMPVEPFPIEVLEDGTTVETSLPADEPGFAPTPDYDGESPIQPPAEPNVRISKISSDPAASSTVGEIYLPDVSRNVSGMYLSNSVAGSDKKDLLTLLSTSQTYYFHRGYWDWQQQSTQVYGYNTENPAEPKGTFKLEIDGQLVSSRRIDNTLYLVQRFTPYIQGFEPYPYDDEMVKRNEEIVDDVNVEDLLPRWKVDDIDQGPILSASQCYFPQERTDRYYNPSIVVVSAIDLTNPTSVTANCVGDNVDVIHATKDALYLTSRDYIHVTVDPNNVPDIVDAADDIEVDELFGPLEVYSQPITNIHKFTLESFGPSYHGSGRVLGQLGWRGQPDFRIGTNQNAVGVVTTYYSHTERDNIHRLTFLEEVVDENGAKLVEISRLPNEANPARIGKPGEDIFAARFMGDRLYLVTFQQIDPLYVVDIANPADPFIAGELEIPGFSSYLHPIGNQLLLGIGKDTQDMRNDDGSEPEWWFTRQLGVKLGLFDVTDPNNPIEIDKQIIGGSGSHAEILNNYKAMAFVRGSFDQPHRLAIPVNVYAERANFDENPWRHGHWLHTGVYMYEISDGALGQTSGLELAGKLIAESADENEYQYGTYQDRVVIQQDAVHYLHRKNILSAPWGEDTTPSPVSVVKETITDENEVTRENSAVITPTGNAYWQIDPSKTVTFFRSYGCHERCTVTEKLGLKQTSNGELPTFVGYGFSRQVDEIYIPEEGPTRYELESGTVYIQRWGDDGVYSGRVEGVNSLQQKVEFNFWGEVNSEPTSIDVFFEQITKDNEVTLENSTIENGFGDPVYWNISKSHITGAPPPDDVILEYGVTVFRSYVCGDECSINETITFSEPNENGTPTVATFTKSMTDWNGEEGIETYSRLENGEIRLQRFAGIHSGVVEGMLSSGEHVSINFWGEYFPPPSPPPTNQ